MSNYTFLEQEEFFDSQKSELLKKRGVKAAISDYSIISGGYVSNDYHIDNNSSLEGRTGWYWTKSDDGDNDARAVSCCGFKD